MSTLSKKLFISVLTLILTVGAFTATTFAWFTLGNTASIARIDANVRGAEGLDISANQSDWYSVLPVDALGLPAGFVFDAVTSADGTSFTKLDSEPAIANTDYIEFNVYLRTQQSGVDIYWNQIELSEPASGEPGAPAAWTADRPFTSPSNHATQVATRDTIVQGISNGARVSVTYDDNTFAYEKPASDDVPTTTGSGTSWVFGNAVLDNTPDVSIGAHQYYTAKGLVLPSTVPSTISTATDIANHGVKLIGNAQVGEKYEITIRIWIEGWDANTLNAVLSQVLRVQLGFQAVTPVTP